MSSGPDMQDLFAAARADAPPAVVTDAVWKRVATTAAAGAAPAGAALTWKLLPGGKLLFAAIFVGAASAAALLAGASLVETSPERSPPRAPAVVASGPAGGARLAETGVRGRSPRVPPAPSASALEPSPPAAAPTTTPTTTTDMETTLAEEARLVTEGRAALRRGQPLLALGAVRNARRLSPRGLEPEELALEARALEALGRTDEALAVQLDLRRRFPDHALSR